MYLHIMLNTGPALESVGPNAKPRRGAPSGQWCYYVIVLSQPHYDLSDEDIVAN